MTSPGAATGSERLTPREEWLRFRAGSEPRTPVRGSWVCLIVMMLTTSAAASESALQEFAAGLALRHDAAAARPHFAAAAAAFDREWAAGTRSPALALNRGRAYFLAGDTPAAIVAFRDGLAVAPWDADLQRALADARGTVAYPNEPEPAERTRPDPPGGWRSRVSPLDLLAASGLASLLVAVGVARRLTVRDGWAVPVAVLGIAGLVGVIGVARTLAAEDAVDRETPTVAVAVDGTVLRRGNADSHPARLAHPLAAGSEVSVLGTRGGWLQVRVPGGAVGWVPESRVLGWGRNPSPQPPPRSGEGEKSI